MDENGGGGFPHGGDILLSYAPGEDEAQELPCGIYCLQVAIFEPVDTRGRIGHRSEFRGYFAGCRRIVEGCVGRSGRDVVVEGVL